MFFHLVVTITGLTDWIEVNKGRDEVLSDFICPFINKEITIHQGELFNMSSFGSIAVFRTNKPIDSDWPVKKSEYFESKSGISSEISAQIHYDRALSIYLKEHGEDVTQRLFQEALMLIESGQYTETRRALMKSIKGRYSFFVCPFEVEDVDHNYEFVIKPIIEKYQFKIERADEIAHTEKITDVIIDAINKSRFVVADLSEERPNCYYEVGYAHARSKSVIILAREGTERHFDLSAHKWIYWKDYKDLKPKFEKEIEGILKSLDLNEK